MKKNLYGEGNYKATQDYYKRTKKFIDSGRVDGAAKAAAPRSPAEARDMKQAEEAALLRAKIGGTGAAPSPDRANSPPREPRVGTPAE